MQEYNTIEFAKETEDIMRLFERYGNHLGDWRMDLIQLAPLFWNLLENAILLPPQTSTRNSTRKNNSS